MTRNPYEDIPAVPTFELTSQTIATGETLAVAQRSGILGAGGQDTSPDLAWSGFPATTAGFMVTMYDPDAPTPSGFWHWTVINLPADITSLPAGAGDGDATMPAGAVHLANDASMHRYLGAAPPPGDAPHHYYVVVSALDTAEIGLPVTATPALASFQALAHILARAMLVPVYGAP